MLTIEERQYICRAIHAVETLGSEISKLNRNLEAAIAANKTEKTENKE